jgi:hypothetical protein
LDIPVDTRSELYSMETQEQQQVVGSNDIYCIYYIYLYMLVSLEDD